MLEDDLLPVGGPIRISIATAEISHGVLARAVRVHHPDLHAVAGGAGESDLPRVWRPAWVDVADLPPVVARQVPTVSRVGIHRPNLILSGMQRPEDDLPFVPGRLADAVGVAANDVATTMAGTSGMRMYTSPWVVSAGRGAQCLIV